MKKEFKVRQGDVMIRSIRAIPNGERKVRKDGALAYGEVTGHSHKVADLAGAEVFDCGTGLYVTVTAEGGISIVHEEHGTVALPKGDYEITIQREYTPEAIRNVVD
jgi:hypothetical protein